ncbi:Secreted protein [Pseudomonas sp. IT-P253]
MVGDLIGGISVFLVMAAYGSALTAGHLEEPQVTKGSCPFRSVPRLGSACPRSGPAPWAHCAEPPLGVRGRCLKIKS